MQTAESRVGTANIDSEGNGKRNALPFSPDLRALRPGEACLSTSSYPIEPTEVPALVPVSECWSVSPWWVSLLSVLALALYAPVLAHLVHQWYTEPDFSHGFLVPVFSGFLLWRERARIRRQPLRPSSAGLALLVLGVLMLFAGTLGAELFISRTSLLVVLTGMVLYLAGPAVLRAVRFPLGYLLLMIPLPAIIYNQITFPLQLLASRLASASLNLVGIPVLREGNLLVLPNYTLEVVDACSGIRSLLSLIALAVAYAYLAERRNWARILLVLLMVPIAVVSNGVRIFGTGVLTDLRGPGAAEGFFHAFSGWLIFMTAVILMLLAHRLIEHMGKWMEERAHA